MSRTRLASLVIVLLAAAAGIGCGDKKDVPSGILKREAMQMVLFDMIQADQYATYFTKDSTRLNLKLENLRLYEQVFQLHHVSREEFTRSYSYYMAHPDLTQTLLDSVISMGNRVRDESYKRAATRPVPTTPPPTTVPVQKSLDTIMKRRFGLPVTPTRPAVKRDSSHAAGKPPKP